MQFYSIAKYHCFCPERLAKWERMPREPKHRNKFTVPIPIYFFFHFIGKPNIIRTWLTINISHYNLPFLLLHRWVLNENRFSLFMCWICCMIHSDLISETSIITGGNQKSWYIIFSTIEKVLRMSGLTSFIASRGFFLSVRYKDKFIWSFISCLLIEIPIFSLFHGFREIILESKK